MATKKYDQSKYEVSKDLPDRFAQTIPLMGVQHFSKEHLTDNDCKALVTAKSRFVKEKQSAAENEDKPAYTDIGKEPPQ